MSLSTFVVLTCFIIMGLLWYANTSKRNKILVRFRRKNKTLITKFVSMDKKDPQHVTFDGYKFDIIPSCIVFQWYQNGIVHMLFPIFVPTLDFTWSNRFPLDPNTNEPCVISPEVQEVMDMEAWAKSYAKHTTPPTTTKKQTMLQQYMPWIIIGVVVLGGFWLYNNMSGLANDMQNLQNNFNAIAK